MITGDDRIEKFTRLTFEYVSSFAAYLSDVVEVKIVSIHDGPGVHGIHDNDRSVSAQIVIMKTVVSQAGDAVHPCQ